MIPPLTGHPKILILSSVLICQYKKGDVYDGFKETACDCI